MFHKEIFTEVRKHEWARARQLITANGIENELNELRNPQNGDTLLHAALNHGAGKEIIGELLNYIDVNATNTCGMTPLMSFIAGIATYEPEKRAEILQLLLDRGADPMQESNVMGPMYGQTAFLMAHFQQINMTLIHIMEHFGGNLHNVKALYHELLRNGKQ